MTRRSEYPDWVERKREIVAKYRPKGLILVIQVMVLVKLGKLNVGEEEHFILETPSHLKLAIVKPGR